MKVTITEDGVLEISAETGLEAFALQCWIKQNLQDLQIDNLAFLCDLREERWREEGLWEGGLRNEETVLPPRTIVFKGPR